MRRFVDLYNRGLIAGRRLALTADDDCLIAALASVHAFDDALDRQWAEDLEWKLRARSAGFAAGWTEVRPLVTRLQGLSEEAARPRWLVPG